MSKGPWKKKRFKETLADAPPTDSVRATATPGAIPPPLPPLGGLGTDEPKETGTDAPGSGPGASLDETRLKAGLGKAFCSVTKGLAAFLNTVLKNSAYQIELIAVEPEEGDLWAEFALPVFKDLFPKFQEDPKVALMVITGLILSGKIRIIKKQKEVSNAGTENVSTPNS